MKIALTHNLQINNSEEEAEFDRPETIAALLEALRSLGHRVEPVEVSGPASRTVARLEALNPDLIFNTAEGRQGRFREAFFPALFDQLGIPYTGSDAYVCALTLDKQVTKMLVSHHGVRTPKWVFVENLAAASKDELRELKYPVIAKPNFEGSSKGITLDSIVERHEELTTHLAELLLRFPAGVLVEEFIEGKDLTVPFLEKASPRTSGVLPVTEYIFDPKVVAERRYQIYDYQLKQELAEAVTLKCPAEIPDALRDEAIRTSQRIFQLLGIRDLGRIDYRVGPDGLLYFIEVNALPSLEPQAGIYVAAKESGLKDMESVLDAVVKSAAERYGLKEVTTRSRRKQLRIGLMFNLKRQKPDKEGQDDDEAEYDSPTTIEAIRDAIASHGHEVILLEATPELPAIIGAAGVDVAFNIAEGIKGRNRESQVPAILELLDIPYTGSDPAALSLALDKALAKRVVAQAGVMTPEWVLMTSGKERLPKNFAFPAIVKPVAEGSSKGVLGTSVVESEAELREVAREMAGRYRQAALVETYLSGREFTVAMLGERRPRVLPPMEIVFTNPNNKRPVYAFEHKLDWSKELRYESPAKVDDKLGAELEKAARTVFTALGCRDVARVDLRLDALGRVNFVECNPLPGLTPDWSDICLIAKGAGMDYRTLIGEILAPAIRRYQERERERRGEFKTNS